ncbi:hypothetical protein [Mesorhizobium sp. CN2-181]|uniref:hypothetical protein n=1 Tax=Mesorhizobium yinganensis TaxID=3157707 RepID=UPI0032B72EAE
MSVSNSQIFVVCFLLGTESGMQVQYLAFAAGAVLIVGVERPAHAMIVGLFALALIMALQFTPLKTGGLLTAGEMRFGYVVGISQACIIIFAVIYYAVQIADRAEAKAEREFDRSEKLLLNVLPAPIADRLKSKPTGIVADRYQEASVLFAEM